MTTSKDVINVNIFKIANSWPVLIAQTKGFYEKQNLRVEITYTSSSMEQFKGLLDGKTQIVHTAPDNIIAYAENVGAFPSPGADVFIFMGGDPGFLHIYAQPEVKKYTDLRGKTLGVDALTTGFSFVLKKILALNSVKDDQYKLLSVGGTNLRYEAMNKKTIAATLLNPPFDILAEDAGHSHLASAVEYLPNYEAICAGSRRSWASKNRDQLVRYVKAYLAALAWLYDPKNRGDSINILSKSFEMPQNLASKVYDEMVNPKNGIAPSAMIDMKGIETVINLRWEMTPTLKSPPASSSKYCDLSYYMEALGAL